MNHEDKQKILEIFDENVTLKKKENQEKQEIINELLEKIKEVEKNDGNREFI